MLKLYAQLWKGLLNQSNKYWCYIPHLMTVHQAELTVRATRRSFLNKAVLNQNKDVIFAEPRKPEDKVLKLKQEGKCPGVIVPQNRNKAEEVDVVLPGKQMKSKMKKPQYGLEKVSVRVEGKQYPCVLREVRLHPQKFIQKVFFQQYIPGKPNSLTIPVTFTHLEQSKLYHQGHKFECDIDEVRIICYNQEYPTIFYVDVSYVNHDRPYTIGDLANTFPPGVLLDPREDPNKLFFSFGQKEAEMSGEALNEALGLLAESNKQKDKKPAGGAAGGAGGAAGGAGKAGDAAKQPAAAAGKAAGGDAAKKKK